LIEKGRREICGLFAFTGQNRQHTGISLSSFEGVEMACQVSVASVVGIYMSCQLLVFLSNRPSQFVKNLG